MKYEFKSLKTGQWCCRTENITRLCASCAAQARGAASSPSTPTVAATSDVPPAPSLSAAIAANRGGAPNMALDAPIYGGGRRPRPTAAAATVVEEPPSLAAAINARRTR